MCAPKALVTARSARFLAHGSFLGLQQSSRPLFASAGIEQASMQALLQRAIAERPDISTNIMQCRVDVQEPRLAF